MLEPDGVWTGDLSGFSSLPPPTDESKGVDSFLGVWYSLERFEEVSVATGARGVVASLEDAD